MKIRFVIFLLFFTFSHAYAERIDSLLNLPQDTSIVSSDEFMRHFLQEEGIDVTYNNKIKLLKSGREKFTDLFAAIRQAKHHIHLEYFNFRNDSIAKELFTLLAEKAEEGVEVRAMFDAFGNLSNNQPLKKKHLKMIREQGIEIVKFDPITFPYINHAMHRDHRKIVVIDGKVGYTGGMNVADYYINGLPKIGAWRDMHMRIEGPAVLKLQEVFLTIWNKETKQNVGGEAYFPSFDQPVPAEKTDSIVYTDSLNQVYADSLNRACTDSLNWKCTDSLYLVANTLMETIPADSGFHVTTAIVDRTPKESPRLLSHAFAASIYAAQKSVRIINPYFVPTSSIIKSLNRAIDRGVKVEIMISSKSDIPFSPDAAMYKVHKLMKRGAIIYLYNGGFHHSKIMMIDGLFCTVGTANLNSRSLRYDYETNAFLFDTGVTAQLSEVFMDDTTHCTLLTPEVWKERSAWKKFVGWFANLFTPFL